MKQLILPILLLLSFCLYAQEESSKPSEYRHSTGIKINIFGYDQGVFYQYQPIRHGVLFNILYVNRALFIYSDLKSTSASGIDLGVNYMYSLRKVEKIYIPNISLGYFYRNIFKSDMKYSDTYHEYTYNDKSKTQGIKLGIEHKFSFDKIYISVSTSLMYYWMSHDKTNFVEIRDYYGDFSTDVFDRYENNTGSQASIELTLGYKF